MLEINNLQKYCITYFQFEFRKPHNTVMPNLWLQPILIAKRKHLSLGFLCQTSSLIRLNNRSSYLGNNPVSNYLYNGGNALHFSTSSQSLPFGSSLSYWVPGKVRVGLGLGISSSLMCQFRSIAGFCSRASPGTCSTEKLDFNSNASDLVEEHLIEEVKTKKSNHKLVDFTQIDKELLPTVIIVGRPNVGKSALFNRLIQRREALVYNTPDDHVTRDIRDGIAKLGDLRFHILDSAGLEAAATSGSILGRTADMTANVISRSQIAIFLIAARDGLQSMDLQVGKWLRKHAPGIKIVLVMNKSESLDESDGSLAAAAGEAYSLGFGDPIAISAETGLGMADLYDALKPFLEKHMLQDSCSPESQESKLPLQLAIVGRPNVGKSTLLNTLLQEERVLVGPEAGLTRDSIRAQFQYDGRTVDTAGWLERLKEKGPASLSIMQTRKNLMRAHVIALVLDGEEVAETKRSMKHAEVVIARQAVEEGRGLVIVVNKVDLLKQKQNSKLYENVIKAIPEEIQKLIPQVTGIPVLFVSALEGRGRIAVMRQVIDTYEKWCLRLSTSRLNRWLRKVHSWKDQAAQPKIKYFTQVKARPPTFVAFVKGKTVLSDTEIRFLIKSLKEDFDMGGIPIRILQRSISRHEITNKSSSVKSSHTGKVVERVSSDKRSSV
ncbi:GTPase Der [Bienertia sinuspersici]